MDFSRLLLARLLDALGTSVEGTLATGLGGELLAGLLLCCRGGNALVSRAPVCLRGSFGGLMGCVYVMGTAAEYGGSTSVGVVVQCNAML